MTEATLAARRANLVGSLWMIASMAGFAIEDAFIKASAGAMPVGQVLVLFGIGGAIVFALQARFRGEPLLVAAAVSRLMRVRMAFEVLGRAFHTLALALIPLSVTTVILQAAPLVVVAGAAMVLGESVGWRRWFAIALGLAGVVIIVQPGASGVSWLSLLAVLGMLGFAGRDLASRIAPASLGTAVLGFYGFVAILFAGCLVALWDRSAFVLPDAASVAGLVAAILSGVAGYACLMKAMRTGEVSAVAPFRYTRLLFGIALGLLFFGETLTLAMVLGSALIVMSGVFILWRGRQAGASVR